MDEEAPKLQNISINLKDSFRKSGNFAKIQEQKQLTMSSKLRARQFVRKSLHASQNSIVDPRAKIFKEIKTFLNTRRKQTHAELKEQQDKIMEREKHLKNLTERFAHRWRKLQSKTLFLSLMRRSLKNNRNYGMRPKGKTLNSCSSQDGEARSRWYLIYPEYLVHRVHVVLMVVLMFFLVIYTPLDVAFNFEEDHRGLERLNWFVSAYFLLDIVLGFLVPFKREGKLVDDPKQIAKNYLMGWFFLDFLSIIPVELFTDGNKGRFRSLLKIPRMVRIVNTVMQSNDSSKRSSSLINSKFKSILSSSSAMYVLNSLTVTVVFVHVIACVWISLISLTDSENWLTKYSPFTRFEQLHKNSFPGEASKVRLYLLGVYYIVATVATLGYGDILPSNLSRPA